MIDARRMRLFTEGGRSRLFRAADIPGDLDESIQDGSSGGKPERRLC